MASKREREDPSDEDLLRELHDVLKTEIVSEATVARARREVEEIVAEVTHLEEVLIERRAELIAKLKRKEEMRALALKVRSGARYLRGKSMNKLRTTTFLKAIVAELWGRTVPQPKSEPGVFLACIGRHFARTFRREAWAEPSSPRELSSVALVVGKFRTRVSHAVLEAGSSGTSSEFIWDWVCAKVRDELPRLFDQFVTTGVTLQEFFETWTCLRLVPAAEDTPVIIIDSSETPAASASASAAASTSTRAVVRSSLSAQRASDVLGSSRKLFSDAFRGSFAFVLEGDSFVFETSLGLPIRTHSE
jgi:hypothetical protein